MNIERLSTRLAAVVMAMCWLASPAFAQAGKDSASASDRADKGDKGGSAAAAADTYDQLYERYLGSARAMSLSPTANINWMVGLSADRVGLCLLILAP